MGNDEILLAIKEANVAKQIWKDTPFLDRIEIFKNNTIDVTNDMKIAQEEIFGSVLAVIDYDDVDEVIRQCNDSVIGIESGMYGLDEYVEVKAIITSK